MAAPTPVSPTRPSQPRGRKAPTRPGRLLPALDNQDAAPGTTTQEPRRKAEQFDWKDDSVLPPQLNAALDGPLSLLALEEWTKSLSEDRPAHHTAYESKLLYCETQLRRLDRLRSKLRTPNPILTSAVVSLLRDVCDTLPPALKRHSAFLLRHVERAIYSEDKASDADIAQLKEVLPDPIDKVPHFVVVARQQALLDQTEKRAAEMQRVVDAHLTRRKNVLEFIIRIQTEERSVLQSWLFQFWAITYQQRRARLQKMANLVLSSPQDILTPFVSWRLFVSQQHLERAKKECEEVDLEASSIANKITEVEMENETQQRRLQESLQAIAELKAKVTEEQNEHARLQHLWDVTQPKLLLSVLSQALEFFIDLVIREAGFHHLELRRRFLKIDVGVISVPEAVDFGLQGDNGQNEPAGANPGSKIILTWVNFILRKAKDAARELQASRDDLGPAELARLDMVCESRECENLGASLCDSVVLCVVYAVLKAAKVNKERRGEELEVELGRETGQILNVSDLWPLDDRDLELRAGHASSVLVTLAPRPVMKSLVSAYDIVYGSEDLTSAFLACLFLDEPALPEVDEPASLEEEEERARLAGKVLKDVRKVAGRLAEESLQDPTPLLHGTEECHALATTSTEQLLLRWANSMLVHVYQRPVENFGSDLRDGVALGHLLSVAAPELVREPFSSVYEERVEQICAFATRCTEFELLTTSAIMEGQSDVVAAFLAQLFLARPSLRPKADALLTMHLQLLERTCTKGLQILSQARRAHDNAELMNFCTALEAEWADITLAVQAVQEVNQTMKGIESRMHSFLGDTLAHRARGHPRTMLDAKEARELLFYTSLSPERFGNLSLKDALDNATKGKVEEVLRKHYRLLRDVYHHYATNTSSTGMGLTLEGLLRLFTDCKLRSRDLCPHHVEGVFHDHLAASTHGEKALSPQGFVEVMLRCANLKFKAYLDTLPEQLQHLLENHVKLHSFQKTESIFQRMAYDPQVRMILDRHTKELKIVFELYASLDASSTEAMQRVNTMNIQEFNMLLQHCDMLDETLTEVAVHQVFDGIQQSATDGDGGAMDSGLGDDDELSFSEFLDGIVAITMYKYPDPFVHFADRVDAFLLALFSALRRHWSTKRISPQVVSMLNALHKKLR